jgi:hypothetical protein
LPVCLSCVFSPIAAQLIPVRFSNNKGAREKACCRIEMKKLIKRQTRQRSGSLKKINK